MYLVLATIINAEMGSITRKHLHLGSVMKVASAKAHMHVCRQLPLLALDKYWPSTVHWLRDAFDDYFYFISRKM